MPKQHQPELQVILTPSPRLKQWLCIIHGLSWLACLIAAVPMSIKISLMLGVGGHFYWIWRNLKTYHWPIRHTDSLGWQAQINHQWTPIKVLDSTVLTPLIIFLHFTDSHHKKHAIPVFSDTLAQDQYRQLIVRLKTSQAK